MDLTTVQLAELALKLEPLIREKAKERQASTQRRGRDTDGNPVKSSVDPISEQPKKSLGRTISEVSKAANLSCDTQWKIKKIQARGGHGSSIGASVRLCEWAACCLARSGYASSGVVAASRLTYSLEILPSPYFTNLQFLLKAQLLWVPSAFFAEVLYEPLTFSHHSGLLFTGVGEGIILARALLHRCSPFSDHYEVGHSCLGGNSFFGCKPKRKISRGHF